MRIAVLIAVYGMLYYSCDSCANLDCLPSNYSASFRILSKAGGTDLLFGPGAIYNKDSIRIFRVLGTDTTMLEKQFNRANGSNGDSIMAINFFPENPADVYMQLAPNDLDTLRPAYEHFNTKCCGAITQVQTIRFNGQTSLPASQGPVELRK